MLAFWILVIALIVLVIRRMSDYTNHRGHANSGKNALEILKERYAKSEIDKKEFEEKKKDIES